MSAPPDTAYIEVITVAEARSRGYDVPTEARDVDLWEVFHNLNVGGGGYTTIPTISSTCCNAQLPTYGSEPSWYNPTPVTPPSGLPPNNQNPPRPPTTPPDAQSWPCSDGLIFTDTGVGFTCSVPLIGSLGARKYQQGMRSIGAAIQDILNTKYASDPITFCDRIDYLMFKVEADYTAIGLIVGSQDNVFSGRRPSIYVPIDGKLVKHHEFTVDDTHVEDLSLVQDKYIDTEKVAVVDLDYHYFLFDTYYGETHITDSFVPLTLSLCGASINRMKYNDVLSQFNSNLINHNDGDITGLAFNNGYATARWATGTNPPTSFPLTDGSGHSNDIVVSFRCLASFPTTIYCNVSGYFNATDPTINSEITVRAGFDAATTYNTTYFKGSQHLVAQFALPWSEHTLFNGGVNIHSNNVNHFVIDRIELWYV